MLRALAAAWLVACALPACAALPCPPTSEELAWSARCFEGQGETRRVKSQYVKGIKPNKHGMAVIAVEEPKELLAVDRTGKVVIAGIRHTGDFDFPNASMGIGRFYPNGEYWDARPEQKCGYFQSDRLSIVVPPAYDRCKPFQDGKATACVGCVEYCTDIDCHNTVFVGGQGVSLGPDGTVHKTFPLRTLETICPAPGRLWLSEPGATPPVLRCEPEKTHPFN